MRKFLRFISVIQIVSNKNRVPKLGKGFDNAYRFNPWNPLSYITLVLGVIIGLILFGVKGFPKGIECYNPFKWI